MDQLLQIFLQSGTDRGARERETPIERQTDREREREREGKTRRTILDWREWPLTVPQSTETRSRTFCTPTSTSPPQPTCLYVLSALLFSSLSLCSPLLSPLSSCTCSCSCSCFCSDHTLSLTMSPSSYFHSFSFCALYQDRIKKFYSSPPTYLSAENRTAFRGR